MVLPLDTLGLIEDSRAAQPRALIEASQLPAEIILY